MRKLENHEIEQALDDNGETDIGCEAIEATVKELSDLGVSTACGWPENRCFSALESRGYGHLMCRGWYLAKDKLFYGMFHIECWRQDDADTIEQIVVEAHGCIRSNAESGWQGFWEFEIE